MRVYSPNVASKNFYSFGSPLIGRTYQAESLGGYRYSFNGKEKDDETYGDGNAIDFGERVVDTRLGRTLSIDPLKDKYPNISPYALALNSPILVVDHDGRANVIYLVLLPTANGEFSLEDAKAIIAKTNESLKALGVNAEVKLWQPVKEGETFSANNLDASDKAIFLGEKGELTNAMTKADIEKQYVENRVPLLTECNPDKSPCPEISELPGDAVALSSKEIVCSSTEFKVDKITLASYLILHGVGHNVGLEHGEGGAIMMKGGEVLTKIQGFYWDGYKTVAVNNPDYIKLSDFTCNTPETGKVEGRNQKYIDAMKQEFKPSIEIRDNYQANLLSNFYNAMLPMKPIVDTNNTDASRLNVPPPNPPVTVPKSKGKR